MTNLEALKMVRHAQLHIISNVFVIGREDLGMAYAHPRIYNGIIRPCFQCLERAERALEFEVAFEKEGGK